jgi:long-subunit fatty acid transport protein
MKTPTRSLAVAIGFAIASPVAAQNDPFDYFNREDFSSEALYATGEVKPFARAAGLGGAYTAIADDLGAMHYNPAGLAQIRGIELSIGMRHQNDTATFDFFDASREAPTTATGLDALGFAYPVPTYRGSLVFALAVHRARSNELESSRVDQRSDGTTVYNDEFLRRQEGGLWKFGGGVAVDVLPQLSVGLGLAYWNGTLEDDQYREIDEQGPNPLRALDRLRTEANVDGFSFDLGLMGYLGRAGRIGIHIESPVWLDISGSGQISLDDLDDGQPALVEPLYLDQEPRLPWSITAGTSWGLGPFLVAADAGYTAWEEFESGVDFGDGLPVTVSDYENGIALRGGVEFVVPWTALRLRGGYAHEPLAYRLLLGNPSVLEEDRRTLSAGAGILVANSFALDAAASYSRSIRHDVDFPAVEETHEDRRFVLTAAYRY